MPAKSEKQQKFMAMELQRKRAGKKTKTDMSEKQLKDYASKPGGDHAEENMKERRKMGGSMMMSEKEHKKKMKKKRK